MVKMAAEMINLLKFNEVWIIPCGERPDKTHISHPRKRLEMTKLTVSEFFD